MGRYLEIIANLEEPVQKLLTNKSTQEKHIIDLSKRFFIHRNSMQEVSFIFNKHLFNSTTQPSAFFIAVTGIYFEDEESQKKYTREFINIFKRTSLIAIWTREETQERIKFYEENNIRIFDHNDELLRPFFFFNNGKNVLKSVLRNKRLLIVSSHKKSIEHQLPFLDKIFEPYTIFENNTFIVIRPPQTHGNNHGNEDWSQHLKRFYKELDEVKDSFDIALVAAGGYGMFIGDYIFNNLDKSSIYVGGLLQFYFGIMGNRWRRQSKFKTFQNSYWLDHPLAEDIPKCSHLVEEAAYW